MSFKTLQRLNDNDSIGEQYNQCANNYAVPRDSY